MTGNVNYKAYNYLCFIELGSVAIKNRIINCVQFYWNNTYEVKHVSKQEKTHKSQQIC